MSAKSKQKKHISVKKVILLTAGSLVIAFGLMIIGLVIASKIIKQQEIKQQHAILGQTLADIAPLYNDLAMDNTFEKTLIQKPVNKCSTIGSESWNAEYTCGTRAQVNYYNIDDNKANLLTKMIENNVKQNNDIFRFRRVSS